ncbi:MAG: transposase, partial [Janthinobacterium lividum]
KVVDLLPDRDANTVAAWLQQHPGTEIISRDRGGIYAQAVRQAVPGAVQVANRWHLLRNLSEAFKNAPSPHPRLLTKAADSGADEAVTVVPAPPPSVPPWEVRARERNRESRFARYDEVRRLGQTGASYAAINRQLDLDHRIVRKFLRAESFPEATPGKVPPRISVRQTGWHILKQTPAAQGYFEHVYQASPELFTAANLARKLFGLIRQRYSTDVSAVMRMAMSCASFRFSDSGNVQHVDVARRNVIVGSVGRSVGGHPLHFFIRLHKQTHIPGGRFQGGTVCASATEPHFHGLPHAQREAPANLDPENHGSAPDEGPVAVLRVQPQLQVNGHDAQY